jgi:hypothetical protein
MKRLVSIGFICAGVAFAQTDGLTPLKFLEGKWEGKASGEPGNGVSNREYRFDLNGRFLTARNRSVYEAKTPGAEREVHEDFGIFSYDKALKKVVLRQFHTEGFVNEYRLESQGADGRSFEFVTVRIENLPAGWRAREMYRVASPQEVVEIFSLAEPGKEFKVYSETRLRRAAYVASEWAPLQMLLGEWTGDGSGSPGQGQGGFSFTPDLQNHVLLRKSFAEYPAANGRPAFRHEDLMLVYHDTQKQLRATYWDSEGHVIPYRVTADDEKAVFFSDGPANEPRYRMTYAPAGEDGLVLKFEIAPPGKEFAAYIEARARRTVR